MKANFIILFLLISLSTESSAQNTIHIDTIRFSSFSDSNLKIDGFKCWVDEYGTKVYLSNKIKPGFYVLQVEKYIGDTTVNSTTIEYTTVAKINYVSPKEYLIYQYSYYPSNNLIAIKYSSLFKMEVKLLPNDSIYTITGIYTFNSKYMCINANISPIKNHIHVYRHKKPSLDLINLFIFKSEDEVFEYFDDENSINLYK